MLRILLFCCLFSFSCFLNAQISFEDRTDLLPQTTASGVAVGVSDIDRDGLDDIICMDNATNLTVFYQTEDLSTFPSQVITSKSSGAWSVAVGDVTNSGLPDLLSGGIYDGIQMEEQVNVGVFQSDMLPGDALFLQGSNLVDINNDGLLDYFACHDDAESQIWRNTGNGFTPADEWIDMSYQGDSEEMASGNYGSTWTDYDNDGDMDLYISKCRQGVNDSTDPRRINTLYEQQEDGSFKEVAEIRGVADGGQSWASDFQDIDNDGDFDLVILNHDVPSRILRNDGPCGFVDVTSESGFSVSGQGIQVVMRDFDNDGWVDILVGGTSDAFYRNNGDFTFTEIQGLFGQNDLYSFGTGDLNNDGFVDIFTCYAGVYNNPTNIPDQIWMNEGNDNHYLVVDLEGTVSNQDAVGARIEIFGSWGRQVREVRAGESYGINHSLRAYFGTGQATEVDRIVVYWPSGRVNILEDINVDQVVSIIETDCAVDPNLQIDVAGIPILCGEDSVQLSIDNPLIDEVLLWSTGVFEDEIWVSEPGSYRVIVKDASDCYFAAQTTIRKSPDANPIIEASGDLSFCQGGQVTLSVDSIEGISYEWSTGSSDLSITVTESDTYSVMATSVCDKSAVDEIEVSVIDIPDVPVTTGDVIPPGNTATLQAVGDNPIWFDQSFGGVALGEGEFFTTPVLDVTTTYYVESTNAADDEVLSGGKENHTDNGNPYNGPNFNGELFFDVLKPGILQSVTVLTDLPGTRDIIIRDEFNTIIQSTTVDLTIGESVIDLNFELTPGENYRLTTRSSLNVQNFGFSSPRLQRSNEAVTFPYPVGNAIEITGSNSFSNNYYYFYDWKVVREGVVCASDRVAVDAVVDPLNVNEAWANEIGLAVLPNPATTQVNIAFDQNQVETLQVSIFDAQGKLIERKTINEVNHSINLSNWSNGLYLLQFVHEEGTYSHRLIKQ